MRGGHREALSPIAPSPSLAALDAALGELATTAGRFTEVARSARAGKEAADAQGDSPHSVRHLCLHTPWWFGAVAQGRRRNGRHSPQPRPHSRPHPQPFENAAVTSHVLGPSTCSLACTLLPSTLVYFMSHPHSPLPHPLAMPSRAGGWYPADCTRLYHRLCQCTVLHVQRGVDVHWGRWPRQWGTGTVIHQQQCCLGQRWPRRRGCGWRGWLRPARAVAFTVQPRGLPLR